MSSSDAILKIYGKGSDEFVIRLGSLLISRGEEIWLVVGLDQAKRSFERCRLVRQENHDRLSILDHHLKRWWIRDVIF